MIQYVNKLIEFIGFIGCFVTPLEVPNDELVLLISVIQTVIVSLQLWFMANEGGMLMAKIDMAVMGVCGVSNHLHFFILS